MICKMCNTENPDGALFCSSCGGKLEAAPATRFCPECGAELVGGAKFCGACGKLAEQTPVAAEPVAPAPAPVSAVPMPVNDPPADVQSMAAAASAMGGNVLPANEQSYNAAIPATDNAFSQAAAISTEGFDASASNCGSAAASMPEFDVSGSAVAVKPVQKNKKKLILTIVLAVVALLVVAALVLGLFFRGFVESIFMGEKGYALATEKRKMSVVDEAEYSQQLSEGSEAFVQSVAAAMTANAYEDSVGSSDMATSMNLFSGIDFEEELKAMHKSMMDTYGMNACTIKYSADLDISDAAISMLGMDDEALEEVLAMVNDSEYIVRVATDDDAMGAEIEYVQNGSVINARGIICSDGTVAVMFPFGSNKCIKTTFDTSGTAVSTETIDIEVDAAEIERLHKAMMDVYYKYYEKAEIVIANDKIEIGGTGETADMTVSGRKITAKLSPELLGEMLSEMVTTFANDSYIQSFISEIAAEAGVDFDRDNYLDSLADAADSVKTSVPVTIEINTMVDFNSNIIGGSYAIYETEAERFELVYIKNGADNGVALKTNVDVYNTSTDGDVTETEIFNLTFKETNSTDGKIRVEFNMSGYATMGVNIDYTGVTTAKLGNTDVLVGRYDIYMAPNAESTPESSMVRIQAESKVESGSIKSTFSADVPEYGSLSFEMECTPENNKDLTTIPSDAYDMGNPDEWTQEQSVEAATYIRDMITDLKSACESSSISFVKEIAPSFDELITELDNAITPMADYYDIMELNDRLLGLMNDLDDYYQRNGEYISTSTLNAMESMYQEINSCYEAIRYETEIKQSDFDMLCEEADGFETKVSSLLDTAAKEVEEAQKEEERGSVPVAALVGTWDLSYCVVYGDEYSIEELGIGVYRIKLNSDKTLAIDIDSDDYHTTGNWVVNGAVITLIERVGAAEAETEVTYKNGKLCLEASGVEFWFEKK